MSHCIPLSVPALRGNEARYLGECVQSNWVSSAGPFVERFEREFASFVGAPHAVACASGTAALHVALVVAGVGAGQEVATSTLTFIASVNAIHYTAARPVLVDSERDTWNLDGQLLCEDIARRAAKGLTLPAAVEPVHVLGFPVDLEPLLAIRDEFGIPIVEDAAEALGARYVGGAPNGSQVGTVGDIGCFSFNGNKVMTTGGGGMIVTHDQHLAERARHLTEQARLPGLAYRHDEVGFNYRMSNLAAALGLAQLEQLDAFLEAKRRIAARYDEAFEDLPLELPPRQQWASASHWLYSVLLDRIRPDRDGVIERLEQRGVQARPLWTPVHRHAPYRQARRLGGDVAEDLFARGFSLPSSVGLSTEEQGVVVEAVRAALGEPG